MEHSEVHGACVATLLDYLIQETAGRIFVEFVLLCLLILTDMFVRRRPLPVTGIPVMILQLGRAPRREARSWKPPFEDHPDP
jgi:hypothetical protein